MAGLEFRQSTAKELNALTFLSYYDRLRLLACSAFEWSGLPPEISARYLEKTLYNKGRAFFFTDPKIGGYICVGGVLDGQPNIYGDPINVQAHGLNDKNWRLKKGQYIMIRNNYECLPTDPTINLFAQRLTQIERSMDVNINAQKTPVLILCDEKQRLTLKTVYSQYAGNEPVIFGEKALDPKSIQAITTQAPYVADKLMLAKRDYWNECMTFLGINNANTDKKERLIVPEVEANDQLVDMSAEVMLLTRQQAADEINKMFGLSVSVKLRVQPVEDPAVEDPDQDPGQEGSAENE